MSHPCDGHACDHCYRCDVLGVCCAAVPSARPSSAVDASADQIRQAIAADQVAGASLAQLLSAERRARPSLGRWSGQGLPALTTPAQIDPPITNKNEVVYVDAPRKA